MVRPTRGRTRCFPRSEPRGNRRSARPERGGQNHFVYMLTGIIKPLPGGFSLRIKILARGRSMSAHVWAFLTSRRRVPSSENLRCVKIFRLFWSIRAFPVRSRKKGRMYCLKISVSPDWKNPTPCTCPEENAGVWKSPVRLSGNRNSSCSRTVCRH